MHSELVEESHASTAGDTGAINCAPACEHQMALCPNSEMYPGRAACRPPRSLMRLAHRYMLLAGLFLPLRAPLAALVTEEVAD